MQTDQDTLNVVNALEPDVDHTSCQDVRSRPFDVLRSNKSILFAYNWDLNTEILDVLTCTYAPGIRSVPGMKWRKQSVVDGRGRIVQVGTRALDPPDDGRNWAIALRLMQPE
jgi:hypothetical protein